jgi:hypothetical protein
VKLDPNLSERLRAFCGVFETIETIANRFGEPDVRHMRATADRLISEGYVQRRGIRYRLTPNGLYAIQTGDV